MKNYLILFTLISLAGCSTQDEKNGESAPVPKEISGSINQKTTGCLCTKMWMPVCGNDGKTYGNSCEAKCSGVTFTIGECGKPF